MLEKIVAAIVAPALFWTGYFYYKDRFRPEPLLKFGTAYVLGLATAGLCLLFLGILPRVGISQDATSVMMSGPRLRFLVYSLAVTGPVEEFFKFLPFILVVVRFREFDEKTDGIIYGAAVALGFASFENLMYLADLQGFELYGRAFASPLTHTIFASFWGYSVGKAVWEKKKLLWPAVRGLFLAALCHGVFNFLTASVRLRFLSALLILIVWIWVIVNLERAASHKARPDPDSGETGG